MEDLMKSHMAEMENYIMKNCLWQFHSRSWDRKVQNEQILTKTRQILCGERANNETPADKCFWVDAVCLADEFKRRFAWLEGMSCEEVTRLMGMLHARMDYLTIDGSLNLELTDQHY